MEQRQLGRYRILEKIAAGGMGVVYRARDQHLERDVALKVLAPGLIADANARRRFRREALALSQLNHPNIAAVHDFDTVDDTDFLVMEWVPEPTLAAQLAGGPLPEARVLGLATGIAAGLAAAHARGIIHCDLKPENLVATADGGVKILDFGIARLLQPAPGVTQMTATNAVAASGTLAYMAPEVVAGQPPDERSDVYGLGVVLYELATGVRPFAGGTVVALMYSVLNQAPVPLRTRNAAVSPALETLVLRAIQRAPEQRFASARDLAAELQRIAGGGSATAATPGRIEALAVLPLENLSGDPAQEYFADGMTEALIADLAKRKGLKVISRTSAMRYKGARKPLPEIARELNVDAIVEGSVVRGGDRVRITAQLIHAAADSHLWAESYERSMSDILALQSEVAGAIAGEVLAALNPGAARAAAAEPAPPAAPARRLDPKAYEAFLKGRHHWNRRTELGLHRALDYFRQALDLDPAYTQAHAGLADTFNAMGFYGYLEPGEAFPRARAAAERVLATDPANGEARTALAYALHYYDWKWEEAEREYRLAIEQAPSYPIAHLFYLNLLTAAGRFEEAREQGRLALELDPLSLIINSAQGFVLFFARDYAGSLQELARAQELDPTFYIAHLWRARVLLEMGRSDEALAELDEAARHSSQSPNTLGAIALTYARRGEAGRARAGLAQLEETAKGHHVPSLLLAPVHAALGETERAFEHLERALEHREHWLTFLDADPMFDPLRSDPRFDAIRQQVGLPRAGAPVAR